jgi:hypothetical protein
VKVKRREGADSNDNSNAGGNYVEKEDKTPDLETFTENLG